MSSDSIIYIPPPNQPVKSSDLIKDLQVVAKKLKVDSLSQEIYNKNGKYSSTSIKRRFRTWNAALAQAGLGVAKISRHSNEDLFNNLLMVWQKKGEQPRQGDMDSSISMIKASAYKKRFGSWSAAVKEFIKYVGGLDISKLKKKTTITKIKKTPRDISLRLRYQVLKRDNFACKKCGRSPATDQSVVLHIDHIEPWSGNGETVLENLQTLCSKCNLGKSNIL